MMLSKNVEERPSSCTLIRDPWFSPLYSSSAKKKIEVNLNDRTMKVEKEPKSTKYRLPAMMSLKVDEWNSE